MVWHILKKDLRLLWIFVLVVGAVHLAAAGARLSMGLFPAIGPRLYAANLVGLLSLISIAVLTITTMHQDTVPGVRQDWLIRPIKRGELILAKLLFVFLFILGPLWLVDLGEGMASGFGFSASLGAAVPHAAGILCFLILPMTMVAVVTRSVTDALVAAAVGVFVVVVFYIVGVEERLTTIGGTGLDWMIGAMWYAFALVGTAVVMSLQFFRRQTTLARCLVGAGAGAVVLSAFLPWHTAFALQEHLSKEPSSANGITVAFSPQLGPYKPPQGAAAAVSGALYVPLRVTGIPTAAFALIDRATVRITDVSGRTLYEGGADGTAADAGRVDPTPYPQLEVRPSGNDGAPVNLHQPVYVPLALYSKLSNQLVRVQIDYYMTLYRAGATHFMPAAGARRMLEGFGRCATRISAQGDAVRLSCLDASDGPRCLTTFLEYTPTGLRNPETHRCFPYYYPFRINFGPNTLITRLGANAPFFDRSGLTHYPVDGSKIADSLLVIETYEPRDHFTRHLNIPAIRLSDFIGPPAGPAAQL